MIVDASIPPANRPQHRIELPTIIAKIDDTRFFQGGLVTFSLEVNGCDVEFRA
jgi:hypothetical protein